MGKFVAVSAGVAVLGALIVFAWIGGELHYRNCLEKVDLRYPVAYGHPRDDAPGSAYREVFGVDKPAGFVFHDQAGRNAAMASCSRWP